MQDYTILCFHLSVLFSECSVGTYSEGLGNEPCVVCPPNSEATQTGLTECTCVPVYYRAPDEGPSVACTREYFQIIIMTNTVPLGLVNLITRGTFLHYTIY